MFKKFGLKLILHVIECKHKPLKLPLLNDIHKFDCDFNFTETPSKILERLKYDHYNCYSTIIVFINNCTCYSILIEQFVKAIKCNKFLKHKLKLIFKKKCTAFTYFYEEKFGLEVAVPNDIEYSTDGVPFRKKSKYDDDMEKDKLYYNILLEMTNTILVEEYPDQTHMYKPLQKMLNALSDTPFISIQEFLTTTTTSRLGGTYQLKQSNGNIEFYFYTINPALAIINNNYIFKNNKCGIREGSEKDVLKLIKALKIAQIPYILMEDLNHLEFLKFIDFLRQKNLEILKCLIFITMTHGTSNNIIYTHDGELNFIEDILLPLQSNRSLSKSNMFFINIQCRGKLHALHADPDAYDEIKTTEIKQLLSNIVVCWSVPELFASPRYPESGTPYVESLCKAILNTDHTSDVNKLFEEIWCYLRRDPYYEQMEYFINTSELTAVGQKDLQFKTTPIKADELLSFFQLFTKELSNLNIILSMPPALFCIGANLNKTKFVKTNTQYFPPESEDH